MKALRCDYCGGFVNPTTYKCPYCGTQYTKPNGLHITVNGQEYHAVEKSAPCEVYCIDKMVTLSTLQLMRECGIQVEAEVRRDFAQKIAEKIAQRLVIEEEFLMDTCEKKYSARLRVVKPNYNFS